MKKINRIQELVKELNVACEAYYVKDNPIMTDKSYDALYDELTALQNETNYILSSSPTQKVQGKVLDSLKKVQHTEPMLSAEKSKDINDVIKFMGNQDCVLSWKLDGLTLVLKYNDGKFLQAVTRGGGDEGEDVTHTVKTFSNIPLTIDYTGYLEIRGEGLVEFKEFERINTELVSKGEEEYSSPRNLAAGSVRQLDSTITKKRNLIFIAFGIVKCDEWFAHKINQFMFLKSLGFTVVEHTLITKEEIVIAVDFYKTKIEALPFLTDGLIVEFNDIAYGKAQGVTGHHSKALFAIKWQDDSYETIFRGVELNTTRTGIVSLIGLFDEVDCDGAKVSRASLHNYDIFKALELGIGDVITVYRANSVIPQIEENLTRSGTYRINMECPSCGSKIAIRAPKISKFLFCDNDDCPSKLVNKFVHFCSKKAMNIDGLSEAGIELFIQKGFLKTFDDLYNLEQHYSEIIKLEGWGSRSYKKLIEAIDQSRKTELHRLIYGIGIPQIGVNGSKNLCKHFNNDIIKIKNATGIELLQVEDFGEITARNVFNYFWSDNNCLQVMTLLGCVDIIKKEVKKEEIGMASLEGKTFVVTGGVTTFKNRDEVGELITSLGGKLSGSVSKNTSYLLNNDITSTTGKNKKAIELNVPIISEAEFNLMIGR
jgi:DNA ligase (NAD+)